LNFKSVLRAYSLLRQLSDDESALLATLRAMSDDERELMAAELQPERKVSKAVPGRRVVEHCIKDVNGNPCNISRRGAIHKDTAFPGYHEFQPPKLVEKAAKKSARATGLAATLNKNLAQQRKPMCATCGSTDPNDGDHGTGEGQHEFSTDVGGRLQKLMSSEDRCAFEIDGKVCKGLENDGIHDVTLGYVNYHEFVAPEAQAAGASGGD